MKNNNDIIFSAILLFNVFVIEFVGFFATGSVSVLAYSMFIFSELSIFIVFLKSGKKKVNVKISGLFGILIFVVAALITNLSVQRYMFAGEVNGIVMVVFVLAGIMLTTSAMGKIKKRYNNDKKTSATYVIMSNIPSILVLAGGIWIAFTGETFVDGAFGMIIAFMTILHAVRILRGTAFKQLTKQ